MSDPIVARVIDELGSHRERFEVFCRALSAEELDTPVPQSTWLVRDFITHLATIDVPVAQMFRLLHAGEDTGIRNADGGKWDVDDWNEQQVQQRRTWDIDRIFAEASETRAELLEHLSVLTTEDIAKTLKFGGDAKRPPSEVGLGQYLQGWCKHDPMHAFDMSRAIPHRVTADVQAWFDDPVVQMYQRMMNRPA
jgi:hypothetical protein